MRLSRWRSMRHTVLSFLMAGLACAQTARTPAVLTDERPAALTVEQAIQEAVQKNLNLLAERYNPTIADARLITAGLRPNPLLTIGNDYTNTFAQNFERNSAGPPEATVRIDYPFERGRKRENRVALAENAKSVAQLQLLNSTRQLIVDVENAFVDVQAAQESVTLANENLRVFNDIVGVNGNRVRVGDLAPVELMRSRVAALTFQNSVRQAELRLRQAQIRLGTLLGRAATNAVNVNGPIRREAANVELAALEQQAVTLRPDLQSAVRDQARSQADLRLQLALGKVDYSVGVQYHHQYSYVRGDSLGFFVSAPLPIHNRNQGEIARAEREAAQLGKRTEALRQSIVNEVASAFQQYITSRASLETIERDLLTQAREVRNITEYSYRRGEASFVEFLDAQRAYNDAVQAFNDARADYARSLYLIDAVSGKVVNP